MRKRVTLLSIGLLILIGLLFAVWTAFDWPEPWLILRHGMPPSGGPTGRLKTVAGMEFIELSEGSFRMGSAYMVDAGWADPPADGFFDRITRALGGDERSKRGIEFPCPELPLRWTGVDDAFWIAATETTNGQFKRFDPSFSWPEGETADHPVTGLTFEEVDAFCEWLNSAGGHHARLPTEAEWEYACRAGSPDLWCFGPDEKRFRKFGWFALNSGDRELPDDTVQTGVMDANPGGKWGCRKRPVGGLQPNAWGLFDTHGNVWEMSAEPWVDHLGEYEPGHRGEYEPGHRADLATPGVKRAIRGGAFNMDPIDCRSARRVVGRGASRFVGFRVVLEGR